MRLADMTPEQKAAYGFVKLSPRDFRRIGLTKRSGGLFYRKPGRVRGGWVRWKEVRPDILAELVCVVKIPGFTPGNRYEIYRDGDWGKWIFNDKRRVSYMSEKDVKTFFKTAR